LYWLT